MNAHVAVHTAGDLVDFMECEHLVRLGEAVAAGRLVRPSLTAEDQLIMRLGREHERRHLASLVAGGVTVSDIPYEPGLEGARAMAVATRGAMLAGAPVIHNAAFVYDAGSAVWIGIADFLQRVDRPSLLGAWSYEVAETKLALGARPAAIVQLCNYSEHLARVQGALPERIHLIFGDGRTEALRFADFAAYYRALERRFERRDPARATYPEPVPKCPSCRWNEVCMQRRRDDDHLRLVADIKESQVVKLRAAGIRTLTALAQVAAEPVPPRLDPGTYARLRRQARLQAAMRGDGVPRYELLPPAPDRGFARLPEPDDADLYFDMEGDPYYDAGGEGRTQRGLEYLFGVTHRENGAPAFTPFWGHDRAGERRAFEAFVDFVMARLERFPKLHVYHYAPYEVTAVRRLAAYHATREDEVDRLLRGHVFVDLLAVVRQSLAASFESYSLKKIEQFFAGVRAEAVKDAMGSVVAYERYRETGDPAILDEIEAYNRVDCDSTLALHDWLLARRTEAERAFGLEIAWKESPSGEPPVPAAQSDGLAARLTAGVDPEHATAAQRARFLAAHLLEYHRREARPEWWAFFDRLEKTPEELIDDAEAIGGLVEADLPPYPEKKSFVHTLNFPPQEHKLRPGSRCLDVATSSGAGTIVEIDDDRGILRLARGWARQAEPLPRGIVPGGPIADTPQKKALARFAAALAGDAPGTYRAAEDVLHRRAPRVRGAAPGRRLDTATAGAPMTHAQIAALVRDLDESYLFVQGPPGSGKTWTGARVIVDCLRAGLRVGVASTSHRAIHHLLGAIERHAHETGFTFRGRKKSSAASAESAYASLHGCIESLDDTPACADRAVRLVAGTAWLFADERMDETLDLLVIDEAGQVSLADALAMATSARSVLFLGDPMQLAHVSQGVHPEGSDASVLAHLLGDRATVEPERGIFLATTHRMHDDVCRFVSELSYDGRLHAARDCNLQRVDTPLVAGSGLRYLPVEHAGNAGASPEEAQAIAQAVRLLLRGTFTDARWVTRALDARDIMVVTPFNAQVRRLRSALDAVGLQAVRAGTVDKFQGQEAAVVFFSMAASSGRDVPRGLEFLFDRNRLNVAVSRARAVAIVACTPQLLETKGNDVEQLRMVSALCRFAELAEPIGPEALAGPRRKIA